MAENPRSTTCSLLLQELLAALQLFDKLVILPGFSDAHEVAYVKFSVQRARLVLWGSCLGHVDLRDEPSAIEHVSKLAGSFYLAYRNIDVTEDCGMERLLEPRSQTPIHLPSHFTSGSRGFDLFKKTFNAYMGRLSGHVGNATPTRYPKISAKYPKLYVIDVPRFSDFVKEYLEHCLDDLYNESAIQSTPTWRDKFYEEMSTIAEDPDSLNLLVQASSGAHDAFGNFASQRLQEREGRPLPTLWGRYRSLEDDGDRLVFDFWHWLLHRLVPNRLQGGSSESPRHVHTTAPHPQGSITKPRGYLAFCARFSGFHSDLAEVDLSTIGSNAELSRAIRERLPHLWRNHKGCGIRRALVKPTSIRLIQFKTIDGRTRLLARDSLPPPSEIEAHRYATAAFSKWQQTSLSMEKTSAHKENINGDKEMQAVGSVFDVGRLLHDRLFGSQQIHNSANVLDLIPRNLGPSLLSPDSETSTGWGIEIVEGPSWIYHCLMLVPAAIGLSMTWMFAGPLPSKITLPDHVHVPKPAIDIFLIALGISLLILVLVKGSRMLEA